MADELVKEQVQRALLELLGGTAGQPRQKHDLTAGFTVTTNLMHGVNGIFGAAGVDPQVFSTRVKPTGLSAVLPSRPSNDTHPIVGYLTGFTDDEAAAEKNGVCDDPLAAGNLKSCFQGSAFGRVERKTATIELNKLGERVNRGEFDDLMLVNEPVVTSDFGTPSLAGTFGSAFRSELNARLMTLGVAFQNKIGGMNWTGNPVNNSVGGGYSEYNGLELLVTTTHTDVLTGVSCPSLASDVKNANYRTVESQAADIFSYLTMIYRYVKHNARTMGFDPVNWFLTMRGDLFQQLTDYWPCVFATYRCAGSAGNPNGTDALTMRQMAMDMQNGYYLMIDNVRLPVVIDDFIPEATNTNNARVPSGSFASDIYLLPQSVRGGISTLFYEYFDFTGANAALQAVQEGRLSNTWTTDGGKFLWTNQQTLWCVEWMAKIEPRLRLLTPHLAGRLQNVMYSPLQHFRDPDPASAYFVDGGNQTVANSPYYSDRYQ
jgi:hypothetical protein